MKIIDVSEDEGDKRKKNKSRQKLTLKEYKKQASRSVINSGSFYQFHVLEFQKNKIVSQTTKLTFELYLFL